MSSVYLEKSSLAFISFVEMYREQQSCLLSKGSTFDVSRRINSKHA